MNTKDMRTIKSAHRVLEILEYFDREHRTATLHQGERLERLELGSQHSRRVGTFKCEEREFGTGPGDVEKTPVFDRAAEAPKI